MRSSPAPSSAWPTSPGPGTVSNCHTSSPVSASRTDPLNPRPKAVVVARAVVRDLHYRLDVNTLHRDEAADGLRINEIGRVRLRTTVPLLADEYRRNRTTGGFIVIDESTHRTVGAGMIVATG